MLERFEPRIGINISGCWAVVVPLWLANAIRWKIGFLMLADKLTWHIRHIPRINEKILHTSLRCRSVTWLMPRITHCPLGVVGVPCVAKLPIATQVQDYEESNSSFFCLSPICAICIEQQSRVFGASHTYNQSGIMAQVRLDSVFFRRVFVCGEKSPGGKQ